MNWDDVRVFLALARNQRLNAAASSINLDPTTVMRRMSRLNAALGVRLFDHEGAGYVLTEQGKQLLPHAQATEAGVFAMLEQVPREGPLAGAIRVSVDEGFGSWVVARKLPQFQELYPNIDIDLVTTSSFLDPSKREVDVAIHIQRPETGRLAVRRLTDFAIRLYASRDYLDNHPPICSRADFQEHPFIGYIPDMLTTQEFNFFDEIALDLAPTRRSASINAQYTMTVSGLGIGVLPAFIADRDSRLLPILPDDILIKRSFWVMVSEDMREVARFRAFSKWLDQLVRASQPLLSGERVHRETASASAAPFPGNWFRPD